MNRASQKLLMFLKDIDRRLGFEMRHGKIDLFVFGGAAAVIGYGSKRATMDLDAYLDDRAIESKFVEWAGQGAPLAKLHGIYFQRANTELMLLEEPDWKGRTAEIFKGKLEHLRVRVLSKEDLILSKLARYNDRDREDIEFLARKGKAKADLLTARYKSARQYYVGDLRRLDGTFDVVLREHFNRRREG